MARRKAARIPDELLDQLLAGVDPKTAFAADGLLDGLKKALAERALNTAKMNGLDPQAYLADVLDRIHDHKVNRLDDLLPWNWRSAADQERAA